MHKLKQIEKKGLKFFIRENTLDEYVINECFNSYNYLDVKKGDTILDAGGNIGAFAVIMANKGAEIISYEPEPENIKLFIMNVQANNLQDKIILKNKALTNKNIDKLKLYVNNKKNKGSHTLTQRRGREYIEILTENWNNININFNKVKIDIEGGEYELIDNCLNNIKHIQKGIIEMHINGFGVDKYLNALQKLKNIFPNGEYDYEPKKKWHTYAKI